jgi:hypothetical protein
MAIKCQHFPFSGPKNLPKLGSGKKIAWYAPSAAKAISAEIRYGLMASINTRKISMMKSIWFDLERSSPNHRK